MVNSLYNNRTDFDDRVLSGRLLTNERGIGMNGCECGRCFSLPCKCKEHKEAKRLRDIRSGKTTAETGVDVFSKVGRIRMKVIKWIWPDLSRLSDALYDYWDKA